ncbi:MAG: hypothetical protein ACOYNO_10410, partial [Saprospiraceae bacterium]
MKPPSLFAGLLTWSLSALFSACIGGHSRTLPIPEELASALEAQLTARGAGPHAPLFVSHTGQRLSRSVLARMF